MDLPDGDLPTVPALFGVVGFERTFIAVVDGWQIYHFLPGEIRRYCLVGTNIRQRSFSMLHLKRYCHDHDLARPLESVRYFNGGLALLYPPFETLKECYGRLRAIGRINEEFSEVVVGIITKLLSMQQKMHTPWQIHESTLVVVNQREGTFLTPIVGTARERNKLNFHQHAMHFKDLAQILLQLMGGGSLGNVPYPLWKKLITFMGTARTTSLRQRLQYFPLFLSTVKKKSDFITRVYRGQHYHRQFRNVINVAIFTRGWGRTLQFSQIAEVRAVYLCGGYHKMQNMTSVDLVKFLRNFNQHWLERNQQLVMLEGYQRDLDKLKIRGKPNLDALYLRQVTGLQTERDVLQILRCDNSINLAHLLSILNQGIGSSDPSLVEADLFDLIEASVCPLFFYKLFEVSSTIQAPITGFDQH